MKSRNILIYLSMIYRGDFDAIYDALVRHESPPSEEEVNLVLRKVTSPCITILDEDYPEYLRQKVYHPPFVLYYYGDISLIKDETKNIAFIGSRKCSQYGQNITQSLVSKVATRFNIVSGLARGIDSCAHAACINKIGKTIAVLGSGIDICYPERNKFLYNQIKETGLLISEYPCDTPPDPKYFPMRNRLVVGLSKMIVITEAKRHSGTQISTTFALMSGKDVCCVPYQADENSLCNELIKQGAYLIEKPEDIFYIMDNQDGGRIFTY